MNRRMRNRTYGGVGGRRGQPLLLPDHNSLIYNVDSGAGERSRTLDLLITNELLYQLSYTGVSAMPHTWDTAKPAILAQEIRAWQS